MTDFAAIKAHIASLGLDGNIFHSEPPEGAKQVTLVTLERVESLTEKPPYDVYGYASCAFCDQYCYLGSGTHRLVAEQQVMGMCRDCAKKYMPEGQEPEGQVYDERS